MLDRRCIIVIVKDGIGLDECEVGLDWMNVRWDVMNARWDSMNVRWDWMHCLKSRVGTSGWCCSRSSGCLTPSTIRKFNCNDINAYGI